MRENELGQLIDAVNGIYGTVLEPDTRMAALDRVAACAEADVIQLFSWDKDADRIVDSLASCHDFDDGQVAYSTYYGQFDPRRIATMQMAPGQFYCCHEQLDDRFIRRSGFYQDFFLKTGLRWASGTRFDTGDGTVSVFAMMRVSGKAPFDRRSVAAVQRLIPHLQRAATLRSRLARQASIALDASGLVRALPMGCVLLDTQGCGLDRNDRCDAALHDLGVQFAGSRLRFAQSHVQLRWLAGIEQILRLRMPRSLDVSSRTGNVWRIHLVPLTVPVGQRDRREAGLILAIFELVARTTSQIVSLFAYRHRLTPAEAAVLALVYDGLSIADVARERGRSLCTIRTQLAGIYDKVGCHRQRDLVLAIRAEADFPADSDLEDLDRPANSQGR